MCLSVTLPDGFSDADKSFEADGCTMNVGTILCFASNPEGLETAIKLNLRVRETNLALPILSLAIVFARTVSLFLSYTPRYANIIYDALMSGLWCFNLTQQFISTEQIGCRYKHIEHLERLNICRLDNFSVAVAAVGMILYSGRVLVDGGFIIGSPEAIFLDDVALEYTASIDADLGELGKAHSESFSPVLAFFPEHGPNRNGKLDWKAYT
ncbi:hypothetical protein QQS21_002982 [Conoideocrella luteorostrata]|uniref:Uncharacterized protein n=1 Tax=Conoideocrella luteorostrata TaxID=1105319 RepID=A0AAJ0CU98_9HYPO|nr:hypothetical protein QQS21_002982 [Conoideocrella luteorostrata]